MDRIPVSGEFYRFFNQNICQIIVVAEHAITEEPLVVYQAMYDKFEIYAMPMTKFLSKVDMKKYPNSPQKYYFEKMDRSEIGNDPKTAAQIERPETQSENKVTEPKIKPPVKASERRVQPESKVTESGIQSEIKAPEQDAPSEKKVSGPEIKPPVKASERKVQPEIKRPEPESLPEIKVPEFEVQPEIKTLESEVQPEHKVTEPEVQPKHKASQPEVQPEHKVSEPEVQPEIKASEPEPDAVEPAYNREKKSGLKTYMEKSFFGFRRRQMEEREQRREMFKKPVKQEPEEAEQADPNLLRFLDADTYEEKYKVLGEIQGAITDRLIDDIAVVLDVVIPEGPVSERYQQLRHIILTRQKYERNRFR